MFTRQRFRKRIWAAGKNNCFLSCKPDGSSVKKIELNGIKKNEIILVMTVDDQGKKRLITKRKKEYAVYTLMEDGR